MDASGEGQILRNSVPDAIKQLHKWIDEEREIKEVERLQTLEKLYEEFIKAHSFIASSVYLSRPLLELVIKSYFDDIYKFKAYTCSLRADAHKQAAYQIKWISKIRPIQILPDVDVSEEVLLANSQFAIFVGLSFLFEKDEVNAMEKMHPKYYKNLVYMAQFRNISGRALALSLCALQELCQNLTKK